MTPSRWQDLNIEDKITSILRDIPDANPEHHLGRPFLTAYQIAIEYARRHPDDVIQLGFPVGGAGTEQYNHLAQYLAKQIAGNIGAGQLPHIEGGFLSSQHLNDINFQGEAGIIHLPLPNTRTAFSIFRLRSG